MAPGLHQFVRGADLLGKRIDISVGVLDGEDLL
jgi:hypothetical protein